MRIHSKFAIVALLMGFTASSLSARSLPSAPRKGVVLDETSTLSRKAIKEIDAISDRIEQRTSGRVMVAVIQTTGGEDHRKFATRLFNRWKIGDRTKDNGILVFVAMKDRKAEIILGKGIDSRKDIRKAEKIMSKHMMPQFKKGRPESGILAAVRESSKQFFPITDSRRIEIGTSDRGTQKIATIPRVENLSPADSETDVATITNSDASIQNAEFSDAEFVGLDDSSSPATSSTHDVPQPLQTPIPLQHNVRQQPQPVRRNFSLGGLIALLCTGGLTATGAGLVWRILGRRNRPRNCELCQFPMIKLSEVEDDTHLDPRERTEERLGSVDYDVWSCTSCNHVVKVRFASFFSRFASCPKCHGKTKSSKSATIRAATTARQGLMETTETCANCNFQNVSQQHIPIIVHHDHSSNNNFSSGSGGGFGGGSSSGGGASGSW